MTRPVPLALGPASSSALDGRCAPPSRTFPAAPAPSARSAMRCAFVTERLNGEDGLGAIYPAMANALMMFDTLGLRGGPSARASPRAGRSTSCWSWARTSAYCQPCLSPVWDTGPRRPRDRRRRASAGPRRGRARARLAARAADRSTSPATGRCARPDAPPGGWAFQYANPHYPDVDDTAVVGMLLHRDGDPSATPSAIARARATGSIGMQSRNGGWGAFDADNTHYYLNHIPFADHGALLDPPTADVTARCVSHPGPARPWPQDDPAIGARARLPAPRAGGGRQLVRPLGHQLHLRHLVGARARSNAAGVPPDDAGGAPRRRLAAGVPARGRRLGRGRRDLRPGMPTGTAVHGEHAVPDRLGAAGPDGGRARSRIRRWRAASTTWRRRRRADGEWDEEPYTAVGFPRVFYLRYHGYRCSSRCWRWPAIATCSAATTRRPRHLGM